MRILLALLLLCMPAWAEEVVLGLSQDEVAITTRFDGSEILVFGAIKRDAPAPDGQLGVIVTVAGPPTPVVIRRKERRFGIWVNTDGVEIETAPAYYAVATNAPLDDILAPPENLEYRVSIPSRLNAIEAPASIQDASAYVSALIRINAASGTYQRLEGSVIVDAQTLFRTNIRLPSALTEGLYETRIFLTRDGAVVADHTTQIDVRKVGLERFLFSMSRQQPFWYGLMSLAIAIAAGWGASAVFSRFST